MLERLSAALNVSVSFKVYEIICFIVIIIVLIWILKQYLVGGYPFEEESEE